MDAVTLVLGIHPVSYRVANAALALLIHRRRAVLAAPVPV